MGGLIRGAVVAVVSAEVGTGEVVFVYIIPLASIEYPEAAKVACSSGSPAEGSRKEGEEYNNKIRMIE